jgi:hypothetical protein
MKIIVFVVLTSVLFSESSAQVELNCPKDWIIKGQVVYYNVNGLNDAAMCLICQLKTQEETPFGSIELCIFESDIFEKNTKYRRKQKICGYESASSFETRLNISGVCNEQFTHPTCGMAIFESKDIDISKENIMFLPCNKTEYFPIRNDTVEVLCPKHWRLNGIKQQDKTYHLKNGVKRNLEVCIICNSKQGWKNPTMYICTTLKLWYLKDVLDVLTNSDTNIDLVENKTILKSNNYLTKQENDYCGYRLIFNKSRYHFAKEQQIECYEFDFGEKEDLIDFTANSDSIVSRIGVQVSFIFKN